MENKHSLTGLYKLNITGLRALLPKYVDNADITKQINDMIAKKQQKSKVAKKPTGFTPLSNNITSRIQFDDDHPIHNIQIEKCHSCEKILNGNVGGGTAEHSQEKLNNTSLQNAVKMLRGYYNNKQKPNMRPRETRYGHISGISYIIGTNGNIESLTFDIE